MQEEWRLDLRLMGNAHHEVVSHLVGLLSGLVMQEEQARDEIVGNVASFRLGCRPLFAADVFRKEISELCLELDMKPQKVVFPRISIPHDSMMVLVLLTWRMHSTTNWSVSEWCVVPPASSSTDC